MKGLQLRSLTFQVVSFSATANPVLRLGLLDAASGAVMQRARLDVGVLWCAVLCCMRCMSPCKNAIELRVLVDEVQHTTTHSTP